MSASMHWSRHGLAITELSHVNLHARISTADQGLTLGKSLTSSASRRSSCAWPLEFVLNKALGIVHYHLAKALLANS